MSKHGDDNHHKFIGKSRPRRVLIIRNAYQKDTGGAEQFALNLAIALKNAGHYSVVVTKHAAILDKCRKANIAAVNGIWHETQEWGKHYYLRKLLMPCWYMWLILRHRIDIVHPQSRDDFIFATSAAHLMRRVCVWTDHADLKYIMDRVNHPHPRMQKWILEAANKINVIMCASNSEKTSIAAVAPELEPKLVLVHNGVFRPQNINAVDKHSEIVIGTNARLVPAKGIGELIDAFADVCSGRPNLRLWLLGGLSGNEDVYKKQAESLGISKLVRFIGYVPNPNDYVASMDIFVHASYHEAFSLAVIEACMLGRSVIATAVGGTPEIIEDGVTGILIPPKSTTSLVQAMVSLLDNESKRDELGRAAQALAMDKFDFQKIVEDKIIPIYEKGVA